MDLFTTQWDTRSGWSRPLAPVDGPGTLVLVFGPAWLTRASSPLREVIAAFPRSVVAGCSTSGQILGDSLGDESLTVVAIRFASTRLFAVTERIDCVGDSREAAVRMGKQLVEELGAVGEPAHPGTGDGPAPDGPAPGAVLVLTDGLHVNGSAVAEGLLEGTGGRWPVSGGMAGDAGRFERTWVLAGGELVESGMTAIGLVGPHLRITHGSQGGWEAFGPVRKVTRSEGTVVHELDGEPVLDLYERYLGDRAAGLPGTALLFPLALQVPGGDCEVVRTVLGVDAEARTMTFAGDVPAGSTARLMTNTLDGVIGGAGAAAREAVAAARQPGPVLALAVSCIGRRLVLGRRTEDELEAVLDELPDGSELVGFYSFGEISPTPQGGCDLHNQTMTITTLTEALPAGPGAEAGGVTGRTGSLE